MTKPDDIICERPFVPLNLERKLGIDVGVLTHLPEHRSGWNYVTECFKEIHTDGGYKLVDFVEKPWGWNAKEEGKMKDVYFQNERYYINPEEIKQINGIEYVLIDKNDVGVLYWNGDEWMQSGLINREQVKDAVSFGIMKEYWVGIIHNPPNIPEWLGVCNRPNSFVLREDFQYSLETCRGIYVFSEYLKDELLKIGGWPCPIDVIVHPVEKIMRKWDPQHYETKLVQIGYWLRRLSSIWEVKTVDFQIDVFGCCSRQNWKKYWINRAEYGWVCFNRQVYEEKKLKSIIENDVIVDSLSNDEYDELLSCCVIFVDLYDSSINNTVLEAITRHTPIVINNIAPIVECLGSDYPLLYDNLDEVKNILTPERILAAHCHLKKLEESNRFYKENFKWNILNQTILQDKKKYEGVLVSLGVDCFPRIMAKKFGYLKGKEDGGLTLPFDLAFHEYNMILELLQNDFAGYTDPENLFINENGYIQHQYYKTVFNHESENPEQTVHFMKNNGEEFVKRYSKRINNFYQTMRSNNKFVFVLHYNKYPLELVDLIKTKWPDKEFLIITLNTPYATEFHHNYPTNIEVEHNNFMFFTLRYPYKHYLWYEHHDYEFEQRVKRIFDTYLYPI